VVEEDKEQDGEEDEKQSGDEEDRVASEAGNANEQGEENHNVIKNGEVEEEENVEHVNEENGSAIYSVVVLVWVMLRMI